MHFVPIENIKKGMELDKDLYAKDGELLLKKGTVLSFSHIEEIKKCDYNGIYVTHIDNEVLQEIMNNKVIEKIKNTFPNHDEDEIKLLSQEFIVKVLDNKDFVFDILGLKEFDDYTFHHSTNVAVFSVILGMGLKLDKESLNELALTGLLHDIGKIFVPREILNKKGSLTDEEFEIIQKHTVKGYEYLKKRKELSEVVKLGALQHHEKFDGSGYPLGLKAGRISYFGRIICIADVYDAVISHRPYRKGMLPSDAVELILSGAGTHFDIDMVHIFMNTIAPYPKGAYVRLSDNRCGTVYENAQGFGVRPKIKITEHSNEEVVPYILDLKNDMDSRSIVITEVLSRI